MALRLVFNPFTGTLDWVDTQSGGGGGQSWDVDVPIEAPNNVITQFTTNFSYIAGTLMVSLNGLKEIHFIETSGNTFQFEDPPRSGDEITLFYRTA